MQNDSLLAHAGQRSAVAASLPGDLNLRVKVVPSPTYVGLTAIARPSLLSLSLEFALKKNTGFAVVLLACGIGVFARVLLVRRRFRATAPSATRARQQMMTTGVAQVVEVESGSSLAALTSKSPTDGPKDGAPVGCAELPGTEVVGDPVGEVVGVEEVGEMVGDVEGENVGELVGDRLGSTVGAELGRARQLSVVQQGEPHEQPALLLPITPGPKYGPYPHGTGPWAATAAALLAPS